MLTEIGLASLKSLQQMPSSSMYKEGLQTLKELADAAHNDCTNSDSSSDSGTDYGSDSILEISEDLKTDTLCLMELDPMFESPALDSIVTQSASETGPSSKALPDLYKARIRPCFSKAHASLIPRLSKAARGRYRRWQQIMECGTSSPEGLSLAERIKSPERIMDHMTDIPPLLERAKQGEPFICFACGQVVSLTADEA